MNQQNENRPQNTTVPDREAARITIKGDKDNSNFLNIPDNTIERLELQKYFIQNPIEANDVEKFKNNPYLQVHLLLLNYLITWKKGQSAKSLRNMFVGLGIHNEEIIREVVGNIFRLIVMVRHTEIVREDVIIMILHPPTVSHD